MRTAKTVKTSKNLLLFLAVFEVFVVQ